MVIHSNNYYLNKMSPKARKVILEFLNTKPDHTQLKKNVAEYYRLREMTDKKISLKQ